MNRMISSRLSLLLPRTSRLRWFSSFDVKKVIDLKQGHTLRVNVGNTPVASVTITAKWQDHCDIESNGGCNVEYDPATKTHTVSSESETPLHLAFTVPEYVNLGVFSNNELNLSLKNKIQGDCVVQSLQGSIAIDKLRGELLNFNCGASDISIRKSLEGNAQIQCRSFTSKMLHGDRISLDTTGNIVAEAIYSAACTVESTSGIEVGLMSGTLQAYSSEGHISVKGIDGQFEIIADKGTIRLQVNKLYKGSKSSATATRGHIVAHVDPELAATLLCQSESYHSTRAKITIVSDDFVRTEYDLDTTEDRKDNYKAFSSGTMQGGRVTGYLLGQSKGTKRPPALYGYYNTGNSGKINIKEAEAQALQSQRRTVSRATDNNADTLSSSSSDSLIAAEPGSATEASGPKPDDEYDLQLIANGNIRVETLSWIEVIRRKYGFGDDVTATGGSEAGGQAVTDKTGRVLPGPKVGRTASAGMRAAVDRELLTKSKELLGERVIE